MLEIKNNLIEMINVSDRLTNKLFMAKERISELENNSIKKKKKSKLKSKKKKKLNKINRISRTCGTNTKGIIYA